MTCPYDPVNHMIYVTSGFYVFQFDVSKLDPSGLNWGCGGTGTSAP